MKPTTSLVLAGLSLTPALARAQFTIDWYTIDGGGGNSAGGTFAVSGTIGQPDAGTLSAGAFQVSGGFWAGAIPTCYANCDNSTVAPVLNVNDFTCFLNQFAAGSAYANCDASTIPPVLNVNDFVCFLNRFVAGCP